MFYFLRFINQTMGKKCTDKTTGEVSVNKNIYFSPLISIK